MNGVRNAATGSNANAEPRTRQKYSEPEYGQLVPAIREQWRKEGGIEALSGGIPTDSAALQTGLVSAATSVEQVPEVDSGAKNEGKPKWKPRSNEQKQAAVDAAQELLMKAVEEMQNDPEAARRALSSLSRFRNRSINNIGLLLIQNRDASRVAGYNEWRAMGYQVRKGETALSQLAPVTKTLTKKDEDGSPVLDSQTGKPQTQRVMLRGRFSVTKVFDISQCDLIEGHTALVDERDIPSQETINDLVASSKKSGLEVLLSEDQGDASDRITKLLNPTAGGWYSRDEKKIVIQSASPLYEQAQTLAHERAHHELQHGKYDQSEPSREIKEIEAEATAFVVLSARGLENKDFTAAYICNWAKDQPKEKVRALWDRISTASKSILAEMETEREAREAKHEMDSTVPA